MLKPQFKHLCLLFAAAIIALSSCTKKDIAHPLDAIGNNADAVALAKPVDLIKATGESSLSGLARYLNEESYSQIEKIKDIKGLDFDLVGIAKYKALKSPVIIMASKDRGELEKSLKDNYGNAESNDSLSVFIDARNGLGFVVNDDYLYVMPASNADEATDAVSTMAQELAAGPLAPWKRNILTENNMLNALAVQDNLCLSMALNCTAKDFDLNIINRDATDGTPSNFLPEGSYAYANDCASHIKKNSLFSFALAKIDLSKISIPRSAGISRAQLTMLQAFVAGPCYADVEFTGDDPTDFGKLAINGAITSSSPQVAAVMLSGVSRECSRSGLPVSSSPAGLTISYDDAMLKVATEGDRLTFKTDYQTSSPSISASELDGCIFRAAVNLPAKLNKQLNDAEFGLKAQLKVKDNSVQLKGEFTDTEASIFENLAKIFK